MSLLVKQKLMAEDLMIIPDPMERLNVLIDQAKLRPALLPQEKTDERLVDGCQARVWLVGELISDRCQFRAESDASMVHGLANLLCTVYSDATPVEVVQAEAAIVEDLQLARTLSPTRLRGLKFIEERIKSEARHWMSEA